MQTTSGNAKTLLRIDASAFGEGALSRRLGDRLIEAIHADREYRVVTRDLAAEAPGFLTRAWLAANGKETGARSATERDALAMSESLVDELEAADTVIITAPMYNFGIPAVLKAWIDQVARARRTFRYTDEGPVGLLADRPVYVVMTSGGVPFGSGIDFASGYLRHVLGFLGLHDVRLITAEATNRDVVAAERAAIAQIERVLSGDVAAVA